MRRKAKFFILCDVIFLVKLLGKFDIDLSWVWKGWPVLSVLGWWTWIRNEAPSEEVVISFPTTSNGKTLLIYRLLFDLLSSTGFADLHFAHSEEQEGTDENLNFVLGSNTCLRSQNYNQSIAPVAHLCMGFGPSFLLGLKIQTVIYLLLLFFFFGGGGGGRDSDWLDVFTWPFRDILGRRTRSTGHCHRRREQNVYVCAFIASVALLL